MTQMTLPMSYPASRRPEVAPAPQARWRLRGAEFATAFVVSLGARPGQIQTHSRYADRGAQVTPANPGAVVVGPATRLVAVQPSITSW